MKNMKCSKKRGFTLIELLAVIIILGILLIIAIPSVTEYISNSRKNSYITIAERYIDSVRTKVNSGEIAVYDKNATYYIPGSCVSLERGGESPYGDFVDLYVVVTYDGSGYNYYFTSRDEANMGIYLTYQYLLDTSVIKSGVTEISTYIGVEDREKIRRVDAKICDVDNAEEYDSVKNIEEKGEVDEAPSINPDEGKNIKWTVLPEGWAKSKSVTITYPSGFTNEYSIDGGVTWNSYTGAVSFTSNGTIIARVTDGTNYIAGSSQVVNQIDAVIPALTVSVSMNETIATTKITVEDTGGSGLSSDNRYQYCLSTSSSSVTGCTWTDYSNGVAFDLSVEGNRYLYVYAIKDNAGNVNDSKTFNTAYMIEEISFCSTIPVYTYTGSHQFIDDGGGNWRIKFLTSGTFTLTSSLCSNIDVFLVGGGGGATASGGGGGYTKTYLNKEIVPSEYSVVVGKGGSAGTGGGCNPCYDGGNGGTSSIFNLTASGGSGTISNRGHGNIGGNGGSGGGGYEWGSGGTDGGNGGSGSVGRGGIGQGTTTREFGEPTGALYASGGGAARGIHNPGNGAVNTGNGGSYASAGGSGIVIIRNSR